MNDIILYTQNRDNAFNSCNKSIQKYTPIKFENITGKKRKNKECFLCNYSNELIEKLYKMFRSNYNVKIENNSLWQQMLELYNHFRNEAIELDDESELPVITCNNLSEHFIFHQISPHVELSEQVKKLKTLENLLLNTVVLQDNKSKRYKIDNTAIHQLLLLQKSIRDVLNCDPSKMCFQNSLLKFD
jgi:hypothetical protein